MYQQYINMDKQLTHDTLDDIFIVACIFFEIKVD